MIIFKDESFDADFNIFLDLDRSLEELLYNKPDEFYDVMEKVMTKVSGTNSYDCSHYTLEKVCVGMLDILDGGVRIGFIMYDDSSNTYQFIWDLDIRYIQTVRR